MNLYGSLRRNIRGLIIAGCGLFFLGCEKHYVRAITVIENRHTLASQFVNTPDPNKKGYWQKELVISWYLPVRSGSTPNELCIEFLTKNYEQKKYKKTIASRWGSFIFHPEEHSLSEILTYRVLVYNSEGKELYSFYHKNWFKLIEKYPS